LQKPAQDTRPILVASHDHRIRDLLLRNLEEWGYRTVGAASPQEAKAALKEHRPWLVLADWEMPGCQGLELCAHIRENRGPFYVYLILLTPRDHKDKLIAAMEAGADDFILEPFGVEEVQARIKSAQRILDLEKRLAQRNEELEETNRRLRFAHEVITKDVEAAARIQQSLLPSCTEALYGFWFESLFIPCQVVGGDIFNYFALDAETIAFYHLDVSGHGIPAAMMSVAVSKTLSSLPFHEALIRNGTVGQEGASQVLSPVSVVRELDLLFQSNEAVEQYFTMVYGTVAKGNGEVRFVQAGHPYPIYLPAASDARLVGSGGLPVGLVPQADFTETTLALSPGDRLFLYSDGIVDCTNPDGERFSMQRLQFFLTDQRDLALPDLMRKLGKELYRFHGNENFEDDISMLALERRSEVRGENK